MRKLGFLLLFYLTSRTAAFAVILNVGLQLEPPNLDPTSGAAAAIDEVVYGNLFEGLVRIDKDGDVRPGLALFWEVSTDGRSYVFHLAEGVKFHDGRKYT